MAGLTKAPPKHGKVTNSLIQDDLIMGTNNSSIVSKRSVERLYFPNESHFFRHFVKKPQRRSPLINRGYWLRMKAVDQVVQQFLEQANTKRKVVVNLGCGYDPLPWQCLSRYPEASKNVVFVDVDYKDLMARKCESVAKTPELHSMFTNMEILQSGDILLRSDEYLQVGCDLRGLERLNTVLRSVVDVENCSVLFVAEVSITYMDFEFADKLIQWANTLPTSRFCLLEQILPDGVEHPFARTMMAHFDKLNTPLRAVAKYPTTKAQSQRFQELGWKKVWIQNLWELWSSSDFLSPEERVLLDKIEPFDEWEEFALFGCHYFLLVADNTTLSSDSSDTSARVCSSDSAATGSDQREIQAVFSANPKGQGFRRFAAGLPIKGSNRTQKMVGNFAGMGLKTRMDSFDVYTQEGTQVQTSSEKSSVHPSGRMCHTITDLGEWGALLVGGRTSPDKALTDCWLYHKWVNAWERVGDLPQPLYRHQAVNLGGGCLLISTGRVDSFTLSHDYLVWSRQNGWVQCHVEGNNTPCATYGSSFAVSENSSPSGNISGFLTGGMSESSIIRQDFWLWVIENFATDHPKLRFHALKLSDESQGRNVLSRFGASVVKHNGKTFLVGGVMKDSLLLSSEEICSFSLDSLDLLTITPKLDSSAPRPLLIGHTTASVDSTIVIMGGSAVCFSFGSFWNAGSYTLFPDSQQMSAPELATNSWAYLQTNSPISKPTPKAQGDVVQTAPPLVQVCRLKINSSDEFQTVLRAGSPAIIEGLNLGTCIKEWTPEGLKEKIGGDRKVIIHQSTEKHMNFKTKNFAYISKTFGEFMKSVENGERVYLRSLSAENAKEIPACLEKDYPSLASEFQLPKQLEYVLNNTHSSPLRISGPVNMWLHYDVMANILCQIQGQKKLLLFPPSDVLHFDFESGASSSGTNVFEEFQTLYGTHPQEAILNEGDVLFLPALWLHAASPISNLSIAVNVFFRDLQEGYAAGKDVYGNRDLQVYEKGRQDIARILKSFDRVPSSSARQFYLQRLVAELQRAA